METGVQLRDVAKAGDGARECAGALRWLSLQYEMPCIPKKSFQHFAVDYSKSNLKKNKSCTKFMCSENVGSHQRALEK